MKKKKISQISQLKEIFKIGKKNQNKAIEYCFLFIVLFFVGFLAYSPHISYKYPLHLDEWNHITEAYRITEGHFPEGLSGMRLGFQIFLAFISYFADLVSIYRFLPMIWSVITAVIIYYITKRLTRRIDTSIMSVLFYASLRSDINLLGTWFFIPLTFAIPFIYLYIYLLASGIEEDNKKKILLSCLIMIALIFIHPISVFFAVPIIALYIISNFKNTINYIRKNFTVFIPFIIIPIVAVLYFAIMFRNIFSYPSTIKVIWQYLIFHYGWGVVEYMNPVTEVYPLIGLLLAIVGWIAIFRSTNRPRFRIYLIWPAWLFLMLTIYYLFHFSPLSPYQRNMYYFVLSLPILSAYGFSIIMHYFEKNKFHKMVSIIFLGSVIILTFANYFTKSDDVAIYHVIEKNDYNDLIRLGNYQSGKVIAPLWFSSAIYPVNHFEPLATKYWYGNEKILDKFYLTSTKWCYTKDYIINKTNASYVISRSPIDCGWTELPGFNNYVYHIAKNETE